MFIAKSMADEFCHRRVGRLRLLKQLKDYLTGKAHQIYLANNVNNPRRL